MARALGLLLLAIASSAAAQPTAPFAAWFNWRDPHIAILPDSSGTYLWVQSGAAGDPGPKRTVAVTFDPARIEAWIADARAFVTQPGSDPTHTTRNSAILRGTAGDGLYLVQPRDSGVWSDDRVLALESPKDTAPLLVRGSAKDILEILDSLQAIARVTPFSASASQRAIGELLAEKKFDKPARADPGNRPPQYPINQLRTDRDGLVIVSFAVSARGVVDVTTVRPFLVTNQVFFDAVMNSLPFLKFFPAIKDGGEVESRVTMPFQFSVVRRPGRQP